MMTTVLMKAVILDQSYFKVLSAVIYTVVSGHSFFIKSLR